MNRNWGKLEDGRLVYFDGTLRDGDTYIVAPTADDFRRHGWLPVIDERPSEPAPAGYHWQRSGWDYSPDGQAVQAQYALVADPPPEPRRWSRLTIKTALAQASMLSLSLAYLDTVEIAPGYTAAAALTDCDYIEEGYPAAERWNAILDGAAAALGKSRAEIDAFLDAIPTEDA